MTGIFHLNLFFNEDVLGYLLMIILLFLQLKQSSSQFYLYKTDKGSMVNDFDFDCLYFDSHRAFIEFCIRSERLNVELNICNSEIIRYTVIFANNNTNKMQHLHSTRFPLF
jgi:hypothetical protein